MTMLRRIVLGTPVLFALTMMTGNAFAMTSSNYPTVAPTAPNGSKWE